MDIGITLLHSVTEGNKLVGVLKSYVIECKDKHSVIDVAYKKAKDQINLNFPDYKFLGIEDIFSVTGKVAHGELMGRSTLYDIDSIDKAKELIQSENDIDVKSQANYYCGSLIYFYKGKKSYSFSILTIVRGESKEAAIINLRNVATDSKMLNNIIRYSVEPILINKIQFVGIEYINAITEDVDKGESFQILFNEEFKSEADLYSILPSKVELNDIINDVFKMFN